ncbi:hypothetical protein [Natronolimnobius baerhuensis]|uniref:Uncharacterized protein n=1 Tax=Natronolimnobius baerhuensis TaxID=253108 RepID=A0A202EDK6_9EURY|nr:hypothetical protein [Natronolimnobius baerhuensis]OVE86311.1 hypothetical protein B2G88_05895 [Natronolimnobius baerhuensis]
MKWRCTWCGKPHEDNDPPCDSCGHNKFEKAVVREGEEPDRGRDDGTVDTGTQYMWVCADCGRQHMRNNPPCSRCGSHDLEKTEQNYDEIERELETPSWLEVAKPYLPAFAVIGIVFLLFATGVIPPSILPGIGAPAPPGAPGEGSEAAGIDLEAAEEEVHERLNAAREADDQRTYDEDIAAFAEHRNRGLVALEYEDTEPEYATPDEFGVDCDLVGISQPPLGNLEDYEDADALADEIAATLQASEAGSDELDSSALEREGLDIHAGPDEGGQAVYVFYAAC